MTSANICQDDTPGEPCHFVPPIDQGSRQTLPSHNGHIGFMTRMFAPKDRSRGAGSRLRWCPRRPCPSRIPDPRRRRVLVVCCLIAGSGLAMVIAGSFLPWVISGEVRRSSYAILGIVDRLGVAGDGALGVLIANWPLVGVLCMAPVVIACLRWWRTAGVLAVLVGADHRSALLRHSDRGPLVHRVDRPGGPDRTIGHGGWSGPAVGRWPQFGARGWITRPAQVKSTRCARQGGKVGGPCNQMTESYVTTEDHPVTY